MQLKNTRELNRICLSEKETHKERKGQGRILYVIEKMLILLILSVLSKHYLKESNLPT